MDAWTLVGTCACARVSLELVAIFTGSFYNEPESSLAIELVGRYVLTAALLQQGGAESYFSGLSLAALFRAVNPAMGQSSSLAGMFRYTPSKPWSSD